MTKAEEFGVSGEWARRRRKEYYEGKINILETGLKRAYRLRIKIPEDGWFIDGIIEDYNKQLDKLYRKLAFYKTKKSAKSKYDFDLIRAIPISKLVDNPKYEQYGKVKYLCPLHHEKTASFTWYKDTNSFYCFGCQEGGSVIDLMMKLEKCDMREALEKLQFYL